MARPHRPGRVRGRRVVAAMSGPINRVPLSLAVLCGDCDTIWNLEESKACPACAGETFAPVERPGRSTVDEKYRQILKKHWAEVDAEIRSRMKS